MDSPPGVNVRVNISDVLEKIPDIKVKGVLAPSSRSSALNPMLCSGNERDRIISRSKCTFSRFAKE